MAIDAAWAAQLEAWVAEAPEDPASLDVAPAVTFTPTDLAAFHGATFAEHRRRVLIIAGACRGPVGPERQGLMAAAIVAWTAGDERAWRDALGELERATGVTA